MGSFFRCFAFFLFFSCFGLPFSRLVHFFFAFLLLFFYFFFVLRVEAKKLRCALIVKPKYVGIFVGTLRCSITMGVNQ